MESSDEQIKQALPTIQRPLCLKESRLSITDSTKTKNKK